MSNLVIVAIPDGNDPVWKVSTEKKPHLTLLYLGDGNNPNRDKIAQFLMHAMDVCLTRFMLDVDRRGELGPDKADVLFFENMWDLPMLKDFRFKLLQNDIIKAAYDSVEQFPEWQPHLTLGYPTAPAKDDAVDHPISYVNFDRIALWDQEYEGVELILKREYMPSMEVAMSTLDEARVKQGLDALSHHGIKGMKWGVRRANPGTPQEVTVSVDHTKVAGKTKIKTAGGKGQPPHADAIAARVGQQKLKKSGIDTLSNKELSDLQTRLNLEQNVSRLDQAHRISGHNFIVKLLKDPKGRKRVADVAQSKPAKTAGKVIKKKVVAGLATAAIIP